jgi:DNA-binding MarR family transcriptional regulator
MERHAERDLEILTAIEEGRPLTQRDLAQRLGVALGLTNLYLKRLATKGYIKIAEFPRKPAARKRLRYLLTPRGIVEKTRLTYEHMAHALALYRRARQALREHLASLADRGMKRVALYGTGEAAEIAYLTLKEFGLEPIGVFTREGGGQFLGAPVRPIRELEPGDFDGLILASFERPEREMTELGRLGIPAERVITIRRPAAPPSGLRQDAGRA